MPIFLISGNPGAGKSMRMVEGIIDARKQGRRVFVWNLKGLVTHHPKTGDPIGWEPLEHPDKWRELPTGALVVCDEIQDAWPASRQEPPEHIRELSKHRHYGIDFLLVTQYPNFLQKYVRDLVDRHEHMVRRFGIQASKVFRWQEGQEDVKSEAVRARAEVFTYKFRKDLYGFWKSADAHTIKAKIPRKVFYVAGASLLVLCLAAYAYRVVHRLGAPTGAAQGADAVAGLPATPAALSAQGERYDMGPDGYARRWQPRLAGQPWSAPAYDEFKPAAPPRVFCMSSGQDGRDSCTCITEQATRYAMPFDQCRFVARFGQYEPTRQQGRDGGVGGSPPTVTAFQ